MFHDTHGILAQEGPCLGAFFLSFRPLGELPSMATGSTCSSTRSSSHHDEEPNVWNPVLGPCCHCHVAKYMEEILAEEETGKESRCYVALRWISCAIKVISQPICYRGHRWVRHIPLLRSFFPDSFAYGYGCRSRGTCLKVSVPSSRGMPGFGIGASLAMPLPTAAGTSSYRLLSLLSGHVFFSRLRLALLCTKPRVRTTQQ